MKVYFTALLFLFPFLIDAQEYYFPPQNDDDWETLPLDDLNWCQEKVDSLVNFVGSKNSKSFIVLKDGKIVIEEYFGNFTQDSLWYYASAGKSVMALLIGIAQEEGFLNIDDLTSDYLGEGWTVADPDKEAMITLWHQLTMTTGLNDNDALSNCLDPECLDYLQDAGTRWAYHNAPYRLLQDVLENATGLGKNIYTHSKLLQKTGMSGLWFNYVFYGKARDMARFGSLILQGGEWDGEMVLADSDYFNAMVNTSQDLNKSYGYLWWLNGKESFMIPSLQTVFDGTMISAAPDDMIAALGKNDQKIYVVPGMNMVVVRQGDAAGSIAPAASSFDNQLWERIMDLTCDPVSTVQQISNFHFKVFPNPATDVLNIKYEGILERLSLYSSLGKELKISIVENGDELKISTANLERGIYFLRLDFEDFSNTQRIMITHKDR